MAAGRIRTHTRGSCSSSFSGPPPPAPLLTLVRCQHRDWRLALRYVLSCGYLVRYCVDNPPLRTTPLTLPYGQNMKETNSYYLIYVAMNAMIAAVVQKHTTNMYLPPPPPPLFSPLLRPATFSPSPLILANEYSLKK